VDEREVEMVRKLNIVILAAALLAGFGLAVSADAGSVRFGTSRTYVMGYEVQGDFVLPVMGVINDEVSMGIPEGLYVFRPYDRAQYDPTAYPPASSAPFRMSPRDVAAVRRFLADTLPGRRPPIQ
jgi:hypothetical protein